MIKKTIIGYCGVDSGQLLITDPCYLKEWKNNKHDANTPPDHFSYSGACQQTLSKEMAGQLRNSLNIPIAVATSTGYGDGVYPVYAVYNEDGTRIAKIIIDFQL